MDGFSNAEKGNFVSMLRKKKCMRTTLSSDNKDNKMSTPSTSSDLREDIKIATDGTQ